MSMGKAVIATKLIGISRVITDEHDGLLVPPSDPSKLADALYRLYSNKKFRFKLGKNAFETAKKYDWRVINAGIQKQIDSLLNKP